MFSAQIDEPNGFGNTALHVACYMGQEAVATELVNHGANVNQPNKCGYTPLHLAAVSTNGALCLELLVNNGADVNQQVWQEPLLHFVQRLKMFLHMNSGQCPQNQGCTLGFIHEIFINLCANLHTNQFTDINLLWIQNMWSV